MLDLYHLVLYIIPIAERTVRIFKNKWFIRFAHKENIDDTALCEAIGRAEMGLIDADLGGGLIKQRVARPGEGRSGGYRTIVAFRKGDKSFFIYGFAKNELDIYQCFGFDLA